MPSHGIRWTEIRQQNNPPTCQHEKTNMTVRFLYDVFETYVFYFAELPLSVLGLGNNCTRNPNELLIG